ncbi:menaquinone biosynthesis decarboxylase [Solitalea canadensis]|uniref:Menaquinone biosynthesis decarboxylase, SCO4490 family n=1 Tax=Solitalea canadensis (strain ATCC 29591 / DSM 3403 / JCM 21819 / LMG 8368 / NBRC 15130 / NCIMB 12057 / USAM 9D) TaxID=929556 RepID=H8KW46_SOLCM|nr:menaquinone biosynthesis decarboxylase [Solitalea canadensis]AFD07067.1 menaquinone biosynthesis decarboxylase, SCO4490 family [Solitalea canadensis DSM 3403]
MAYKNLQHFIETLEKNNQLVRIKEYVNPELEVTEITDRVSKVYGPALLFENTGTDFPLLINSMGNYERMCMALGINHMDEITHDIEALFKTLTGPKEGLLDKLKMLPKLGQIASWMPKVVSGRGECQEVVMTNPDITKFPVLKCWPEDGGPFITLPVIHTKDPITGIRNVGMYRMQIFGPQLTALHWHKHKVSARHFNEYKKLGQKMPVAVALGGDPVYTYAATAPLPDGIDEYMLAGFLRKKKVELVQCLTQDVQVPADADIIIEGYVDPEEDFIWEGPFGDHTGYYSLADWYPRFHITCITHRKNAVYPATIVGIPPQEDAWIGKATERIFLAPIKMTMVPEIVDMVLPMEGVFHNLVIVKIKKSYPGQALKVMNSMWGAGQMMFTKMIIVVDGDVNIHDNAAVAKYISANVDPESDILFTQGPMDVLDHSCSKMAFGGKMGIDATQKLPEELRGNGEFASKATPDSINKEEVKANFSEIIDINDALLKIGISLVIVSVEKNRKGHIEELNKQLFNTAPFKNVKVVLYLEHTIDISDIADAVWRFSNNVDPRRDGFIIKAENNHETSHVGLDGTRKTKEFDGFERDWPNILASTTETIEHIDKLWDKLGLGKFITSPSLKYQKQLYKGGAVAEE